MTQVDSGLKIARQWFEPDIAIHNASDDPAREAFEEGLRIFKTDLTQDGRKRESIARATSAEDVLEAVAAMQTKYEKSRVENKVQERLQKFTNVVHYYGNIMDVLAQHHPEYVALAWGAMKFLLVASINHEGTISALAKGLLKIGNTLPRLQLAAILYSTARMKRAIAELYAYVIKFLIRAHNWFQETKLQHAWHAISRPPEMRYADLIEEIEMRSKTIESLTIAGGQAEQRIMHRKLDAEGERVMTLETEIRHIKTLLISFQSMASGAFLDTNQRLSDLQLSNVLDHVAKVPFLEPLKALNVCMIMQKRRRLQQKAVAPDYSWLTPGLQDWSESPFSSLVIIRGRFQSRFEMKDLAVGLIHVLQNAGVPVIWLLKSDVGKEQGSEEKPDAIDLIKYFVSQALRLCYNHRTEAYAASICARFRTATAEADWLSILASVLDGVPEIYFLLDMEAVHVPAGGLRPDFWPSSFCRIFNEIVGRGCKTRVRVCLITYGSAVLEPARLSDYSQCSVLVVRVPTHTQSHHRKGKGSKIQRNYGLRLNAA